MNQKTNNNDQVILDRWFEHLISQPDNEAIIHWKTGEIPYVWTFKTLFQTALRFSDLLKEKGIKRGDVCSIIIHHNIHFYPLYLGISIIGAIPAVLAPPNPRLHPDKFRDGLKGISKRSGIDWILTEKDLIDTIKPLVINHNTTIRDIFVPLEWPIRSTEDAFDPLQIMRERDGFKSTDPLLLQHSSGTTGLQKAVVLSHKAVLEHMDRYGKAIDLKKSDKVVSWLPLYHDMGLIAAFHLPLVYGIPIVQIDPFEWIQDPVQLLNAISEKKGTIVWLPNFAYNFMADKIYDEDLQGISLKSIRMVINCSEPVRADSHKKFLHRFSPLGLKKESISACYAMAETTFAVTQTNPGYEARIISLNRELLSKGIIELSDNISLTKECVSSGKLIDGCKIRIIDESGRDLIDGYIGEILINSVSLFDGYRNYSEKTAEVMKDGWYYSGDLGFKYKEEYYIIGRKKDIIIIAGKNIYPEDIEDVLNGVKGLIPGRIVAFGVFDNDLGTEKITVIAETELELESDKRNLISKIIESGMQIDITISNVILVPSRWLIKSSSGKPSRKANKERILNDGNIKED